LVHLTHTELHQFSIAKRVIIPGYQVVGDCNECSSPIRKNSDEITMMYPFANDVHQINGTCEECGADWKLKVQIHLSISPVP